MVAVFLKGSQSVEYLLTSASWAIRKVRIAISIQLRINRSCLEPLTDGAHNPVNQIAPIVMRTRKMRVANKEVWKLKVFRDESGKHLLNLNDAG